MASMHDLLKRMAELHASDLHLTAGSPPLFRIDGSLVPTEAERIPPEEVLKLAYSIMNETQRKTFEQKKEVDFSFSVQNLSRYRSNVFLQRGCCSCAIRAIPFSIKPLEELGLPPVVTKLTERPNGLVLVTGPTGSGKSTTLYSALNELKDPRKNITTVEDPVEYRLGGINQTQVKPEIDLDFAICLRAILRQDPDIVLIGEIRDRETMEIAIKASLTGHLVLSTFHTNDAPSAISRLVYMGLEPYLLASSLNLVLAQRLVRRVCDKCSQPMELNDDLIRRLGITPQQLASANIRVGKGCGNCNGTGYRGRLPIFEFLVVDGDMRQLIATGGREAQLRELSRKRGYGDLLSCGVRRMLEGKTTPEEVLRVTISEEIFSE